MYGLFADRKEAGERLAQALMRYKGDDVVVLAVPRGGVPVALAVAKALNAPLDIVLVRKIGAPSQPELAVAAVVDGEHAQTVRNPEVLKALRVSEDYMRRETERQLAEIERRRRVYLGDKARPRIEGKTAIIVDDGIATGATIQAALLGVRLNRPKRLVLAAPVAPADTLERLRGMADDVVCLETPEMFLAIGQFYRNFDQLADDEVTALLGQATTEPTG